MCCAGADAEGPLNWGPEGQEGPVLATGEPSFHLSPCSLLKLCMNGGWAVSE